MCPAANRPPTLVGVSVPLYDGQLRDAAQAGRAPRPDKAVATSSASSSGGARGRRRTECPRDDPGRTRGVDRAGSCRQHDFDAAFDAYRHGVGTITVVIDARHSARKAGDAATHAHSAALSAAAMLAFATGALGSAPREP